MCPLHAQISFLEGNNSFDHTVDAAPDAGKLDKDVNPALSVTREKEKHEEGLANEYGPRYFIRLQFTAAEAKHP